MSKQRFAEQEVLAIQHILNEQLQSETGTREQFDELQSFIEEIVKQASVIKMDPHYEGTFEELKAYIEDHGESDTLDEHVRVNNENIKRWLEEINIYNTTQAVTTDDDA